MNKADHSGHRDRLRAKYINYGVEALAPHEVLELMLYYAIPYRNTNDVAKKLLDTFGSLSAVFDASIDMLVSAGLTRNQAVYMKLIPDVTRLYALDKHSNARKQLNAGNIADYLIDKYIGLDDKETVFLVLVDVKGKELFCGPIVEGEFSEANISVRSIMHLAMNYNASGAFLAHNHPSGLAVPSKSDYTATIQIKKALASIGVNLYDHFIIADRDAVSMRESGIFELD